MKVRGALTLIYEYAKRWGWTGETMIEIMAQYINSLGDPDAFSDYLERRAPLREKGRE